MNERCSLGATGHPSFTKSWRGIGLLTLDGMAVRVAHNTRNLCWAAKTVDGRRRKISGTSGASFLEAFKEPSFRNPVFT